MSNLSYPFLDDVKEHESFSERLYVQAIAIDSAGNKWFGTSMGVSKLLAGSDNPACWVGDTLTMCVEEGLWPPPPGRKVIAKFHIDNPSAFPQHLVHAGVRGRRNGAEFWDIGFWEVDIPANGTFNLEANNERLLEPGDYSFRVSYTEDGVTWTEVGNEINFTVGSGGAASPLVDMANSIVTASPASVEANGVSASTVTITLKNTAGAPISGKTVQLVADRGAQDFITQPTAPTNAQGQTTATVRSSVPGTATLWAWVMNGGIKLASPATVTFGATSPVPDELRASASRLVQRANRTLDTMWGDSQAIVGEAGYFRGAIGADASKLTTDLVSGLMDIGSGVTDWQKAETAANFAFPGWDSPAWASPAICKISNAFIKDATSNVFSNDAAQQLAQLVGRGGLYLLTAQKDNKCLGDLKADFVVDSWNIGNLLFAHIDQPALTSPIKKVVNDARTELQIYLDRVNTVQIPPLTSTEIDVYKKDLTARDLAFIVYEQRLKDARLTLESIRKVNSSPSWGGDSLQTIMRLSAKNIATYMWDGPGQALVGGTLGVFDTYMNTNALNESILGSVTANSTLVKTVPEAISAVKDTTSRGLRQIADGKVPCTPKGEISNVQHFSAGDYWHIFWREQASYTTLQIKNTGNCTATFQAVSRYLAQTTRLSVPWAELWMQDEAQLKLSPGQSGYVKIEYKTNKYGYSPREQQSLALVGTVPASTINIDLVAANNTGTFWVGHKNDTWLPARTFVSGLAVAADIGIAATTPTVDEPLVVMAGGSLGQPYQTGYLWVNNPFTATVSVTVTQPLPAAVTSVLEPGTGQVIGNDIIWTGFVTPLATEAFTFTFETSTAPGETVTLPAATLDIVNPLPPNDILSTSAEAPSFVVPRHLAIQRNTPDWIAPATSATAMITVTNHLATASTGSFTLNITDASDSTVWSDSQPFTISGEQSQALNFVLPTSLAMGDYQFAGIINSQGTNETVFSDPMSVGAQPPELLVSALPVAVDGTVAPDSNLTYRIQVTNTADITLSNVVISSSIPAGLTVVPGSISDGGSQDGNNVWWNLGSIAPGANRILTYDINIPADYITNGGRYIESSALLQSQESPEVRSPSVIVLVYAASISQEVYLPIVLKN